MASEGDLPFLFLFLVFSAYCLYRLDFSDLWSDEIYTLTMINGPLWELPAKLQNDLHPPLYYLLLKGFTAVAGESAYSLRLFSVIALLLTIVTGYCVGKRLFGRRGALCLCLMMMATPMPVIFSHQARMYTWAAFAVTGLFLYALLYLQTGNRRHLLYLLLFTLMAMYMHYYSLAAAFIANVMVFGLMVNGKRLMVNGKWLVVNALRAKGEGLMVSGKWHLYAMGVAAVLYLPWLARIGVQVQKVQQAFWAPEVSMATLLSCFGAPFSDPYTTTWQAYALMALCWGLAGFALYRSASPALQAQQRAIRMAVGLYVGTILLATAISLVSQPILFSRYAMAIALLPAFPVALLLAGLQNRWIARTLAALILVLGVSVSSPVFTFSYGPYKQAVEHIAETFPEVKKVVHISEITAGPMLYYNGRSGLQHCWLKAKMSNVDAFTGIRQYNRPQEFLQPGETFLVAQFNTLPLNIENLDLLRSQSELLLTDTVINLKVESGNRILLYLLRYKSDIP